MEDIMKPTPQATVIPILRNLPGNPGKPKPPWKLLTGQENTAKDIAVKLQYIDVQTGQSNIPVLVCYLPFSGYIR
jgi:hypothetical protein